MKRIFIILMLLQLVVNCKSYGQCSPAAKYDKLVSGYHSSIAITSTDSFKVWGQDMSSDGTTDLTAPKTLNVANFQP